MQNESGRKTVIFAAGAYLLFISCFMFFASLYRSSQASAALLIWKMAGFVAAALVFSTGLGLLFRKQWARYALLVFSALAIISGISTMSGVIISKGLYPEYHFLRGREPVILFAIWLIFYVAIPVFFLFSFSRNSVSGLFRGFTISWPQPVGILALVLYTGILAVMALLNLIFGRASSLASGALTGIYLKAYLAVIILLSFLAGLNLWQRKFSGWLAAVILFSVYLFERAWFFAGLTEYKIAMIFARYYGINNFSSIPYGFIKLMYLLPVLLNALIILYLIGRRSRFTKGESNALN